jgi:hypothetical protein
MRFVVENSVKDRDELISVNNTTINLVFIQVMIHESFFDQSFDAAWTSGLVELEPIDSIVQVT